MIIFIILLLMFWMITTLVRNALMGIQLNEKDSFNESLEVIIPVLSDDFFNAEEWVKALQRLNHLQQNNFRLHFLFDKHHSNAHQIQNLPKELPWVEYQIFTLRPEQSEPIPWMISQIADQIKGSYVLIGDPDVIAVERGLISMAYNVEKFERPFLFLPQISKQNIYGEAFESINAGVAFASFYGRANVVKNIYRPLLSLSSSWAGMSLKDFNQIPWSKLSEKTWKECLLIHWEKEKTKFKLAFGEKLLLKYYPLDNKDHFHHLALKYKNLWLSGQKWSFITYASYLFIWFFPWIAFFVFPLWAIASFFLVILYSFFTKIIFQESWTSIFLRPISNFFHLLGLCYWKIKG